MKKYLLLLTAFILTLGKPLTVQAVCPVCTIGVAAGLGLSRWLGIDDTISGVWIGAVTVSLTLWTHNWLTKKNIRSWWSQVLNVSLWFGGIVIPLALYDIIGHPGNVIWNMDKLLFGITGGAIIFFASAKLYEHIKHQNGGHAHFPFEKVVLPLTALTALSLIFYFLTR